VTNILVYVLQCGNVHLCLVNDGISSAEVIEHS